ncbi:MAG TPA: hypothetical protein VLX92_24365, partial [Kofleriaceae bacterium]|nr:hypothetical protein [Kofleriaceae bacterium]
EGDHAIEVRREGSKPYAKHVTIQAKTETSLRVNFQPEQGHGDAIAAYIVTAVFGGAGIYLGVQANNLHDDLQKAIKSGTPPPDNNDPRFLRGKIYAIAADATFGVAAISLITAVWYTFRTKGAPTTGTFDMHAVTLQPEVGSGYAGLGMEVSW